MKVDSPCFRASTMSDLSGRRNRTSTVLVAAFRIKLLRGLVLNLIDRIDGGELHSLALRKILADNYGVNAGLYSYGSLLRPGIAPRGTLIGRYCSFGPEISIFRRNHPKEHLSLHPFFYLKRFGFVKNDGLLPVEDNPLIIGNDVWIGASAIILPGCRRIGDGAIVGAGSVVTKCVSDFSIVAGNPAKIVGFRFSDVTADAVRKSAWWNRSIYELSPNIGLFVRSFSSTDLSEFTNAK